MCDKEVNGSMRSLKRMKTILLVFFSVVSVGRSELRGPGSQQTDVWSADSPREILIESLVQNTAEEGLDSLLNYVLDETRRGEILKSSTATNGLFSAVYSAVCLRNFAESGLAPETCAWLFGSNERVRLMSEKLTLQDDVQAVTAIIQKLYDHDPDQRDRWFRLIIALALVWDTPRTEMHQQIGEGWLEPDDDICLYYDYFKTLFDKRKAKVKYAEHTIDSLLFIVDVPAPVRELKWALKNVKGRRAKWGEHYEEIIYDYSRLQNRQYDWPHRAYKLEEIRDCHGICVDQAYFAVLTARAFGIPALYFQGKGKFGGHAWFGFMKSKDAWELDIGRYSRQGYAVGFAVNPQTGEEMTDHELEYICARALRSEDSRVAAGLTLLASLLTEEGVFDHALRCAHEARRMTPLFESAWDVEYDIYLKQSSAAASAHLRRQANAFKKYPDKVARIKKKQAELLAAAGNVEKANRILEEETENVDRDRDDLQQSLIIAHARQLQEQGDLAAAFKMMEKTLLRQKKNGAKLIPLMKEYLILAAEEDRLIRAQNFFNENEAEFQPYMPYGLDSLLDVLLKTEEDNAK